MALKVSIGSVLSLLHVLSGLSSLVMAIPHPSPTPSVASVGLPSENATGSYEPGDMRVTNMIQYENIKEFGEHIYYTVEEYSGEQSASRRTNYLCDIQLNRRTNWPLSVEVCPFSVSISESLFLFLVLDCHFQFLFCLVTQITYFHKHARESE